MNSPYSSLARPRWPSKAGSGTSCPGPRSDTRRCREEAGFSEQRSRLRRFGVCYTMRSPQSFFAGRWLDFDHSLRAGVDARTPSSRIPDRAARPRFFGRLCLCARRCSWKGCSSDEEFGGSGSTLIACDKTRRQARLLELDPKYCDVIVRRWQTWTGGTAISESDGRSFEEIAGWREAAEHAAEDPAAACEQPA